MNIAEIRNIVIVTGSSGKIAAKRIGSAAFFEPLTSILPVSGTPPSMTNLSIYIPEIFFYACGRENPAPVTRLARKGRKAAGQTVADGTADLP